MQPAAVLLPGLLYAAHRLFTVSVRCEGAESSSTPSSASASAVSPVAAQARKQPHVVVVGYGWAGREFVGRLEDSKDYHTTVVAKRGFVQTPLLVKPTAAAGVPEHRPDEVIEADCTALDFAEKAIVLDDARRIPYDRLVIAVGTLVNTFGVPGVEQHAQFLKTPSAAKLFWQSAKAMPKVVHIVGAGATGVEAAFGVKSISPETEVHLHEAAPFILAPFSEAARAKATELMREAGIHVHVGKGVKAVEADGVVTPEGRLPGDLTLWAGGIKLPPLVAPLAVKGRLPVTPTLRLIGHDDVYAIGDVAGAPTAQNAVQQGRYLADRFNHGWLDAASDGKGAPFTYQEDAKMVHCGTTVVLDTKWGCAAVPVWFAEALVEVKAMLF